MKSIFLLGILSLIGAPALALAGDTAAPVCPCGQTCKCCDCTEVCKCTEACSCCQCAKEDKEDKPAKPPCCGGEGEAACAA